MILYARRLFPTDWRMKPFEKLWLDLHELVFDGASSRHHVGRPLAFCSGTNAALYASTGAVSPASLGSRSAEQMPTVTARRWLEGCL